MKFMEALGLMMLIVLLIAGFGYWIKFFMSKVAPDFKYWFKYKFLKTKYDEEEITMLMEDLENNVSETDLVNSLLVLGKATPKKAKELLYIYRELKKLQGGGNK